MTIRPILNELTTSGRTVRLDFAFADGKEDGEGAEDHDHGRGEEEVDAAHGYGEGIDNEVAAHLDDAPLLLHKTDDEA